MDKRTEIVKYIIKVSDELNKKYLKILLPDKINQAISVFANSNKSYENVLDEIDALATISVKKYIKLQRIRPMLDEEKADNLDRNG